jgi:hypothetical protein
LPDVCEASSAQFLSWWLRSVKPKRKTGIFLHPIWRAL